MNVLIAPDKFKEALDAPAVAAALAAGVRAARPDAQVTCCPLADGGDGTGLVLAAAFAGPRAAARGARRANPLPLFREGAGGGSATERTTIAPDARGAPRSARWWFHAPSATAIIETAEAIGLRWLPAEQRDPMQTSSFGAGVLIQAALDAGARRVLICVGGSATVDGGAGCLQALGWRLLDREGRALAAPVTGGTLADVAAVAEGGVVEGGVAERGVVEGGGAWASGPRETDSARARGPCSPTSGAARSAELIVLTDVDNPLCGPQGAAAVFGPQKGATPAQVALLDAALTSWAAVLAVWAAVRARHNPNPPREWGAEGQGAPPRASGPSPSSPTPPAPRTLSPPPTRVGGSDAQTRVGGSDSTCAGRSDSTRVGSSDRTGAAGGLAAGLRAAGARLVSGFDYVADAIGLDEQLAQCDICLTGEGRLDAQTSRGKVVAGVAARARRLGKPVVAFVGATQGSPDELARVLHLDVVVTITPPGTPLPDALAATASNLTAAARRHFEERRQHPAE